MAAQKKASVGDSKRTAPIETSPGDLGNAARPARRRPRRIARRRARSNATQRTALSAPCRIPATEPLYAHLRSRVIGQDDAIDALVCSWSRLLAGLRDPSRPLLTILLLGPTGVGKTETARALAEILFGTADALTRVDCEEYAHGHEVAKLLGSPPGYVGADIEPLLSQGRIDRAHWRVRQAKAQNPDSPGTLIDHVHDPEQRLHSIILFDEIEKAHPTLWNSLLGVLDDGRLTLGNNKTTDLTRSIILMTSNVGSREMSSALDRRMLGFADPDAPAETVDPESLQQIARVAAQHVFPAEFLNRLDEVLAYAPLGREDLERIFDKFLAEIGNRALRHAGIPLLIRVSDAARCLMIDAGTDARLGARPLRRAMERMLVDPLSRLIASEQLGEGDVVDVELEDGELAFYRAPRQAGSIVA